MRLLLSLISAGLTALIWQSVASPSEVHMLVPGFRVEEIPVQLPNINNLRFSKDGRLFALAYDGHIYVLKDTNGDGLEDQASFFWDKDTISVPVGMAVADEGVYVSSHGKVSLLRDTDGDGKADVEQILATNWPPTDVGSGGVDATAVTLDRKGNIYFGLLTADYSNPYRVKDGVSHYDLAGKRGTIQKLTRGNKESRTIATGIRVPYTLAFNHAGDLFVTDQEGETWCPNGNPLDELNQIIEGHNYGFPPRDDKWLPVLKSENPVVAFGPQHQSSCGMTFNDPHKGQGLFGPKWWEGDAFVAGESRGKIWRVRLVKTAHGYVGREFTIARLSMLTTDVAISPAGALYVCCHSGQPDWGTGPKGKGKIFKITYSDRELPQPVIAWASEATEVRIAFDRPIDSSITNGLLSHEIDFGEYVRAGDEFEVLKPPYNVVKQQEATPRGKLKIVGVRLLDPATLALTTGPQPQPVSYALALTGIKPAKAAGPGSTAWIDYDLSGTMPEHDQLEFVKGLPRGHDIAKALQSKHLSFPGFEPKPYPYIHNAEPEQAFQYAEGDFEEGRALFFGDKLKCATCHRIRGEGANIGPDLSNLVSRDAASVLRDIKEPSASIHPDYVAYNVRLTGDETLVGFVRAQDEQWLQLTAVDGKQKVFRKSEVRDLQPSTVSLMPAGLLDALSQAQIGDLLTFLLNAPPARARADLKGLVNLGASMGFSKPVKIVLVASKQDHGPGQHDYPNWQKVWHSLLERATNAVVEDAWLWPTDEQFDHADALLFYYWNRAWSTNKLEQLDQFLAKGKGVIVLHSATIGNPIVGQLAERIGLASDSGKTKYQHTPIDLRILPTGNTEITRGLPSKIHFIDEPYWPLIGNTNNISVVGTAEREGKPWPMMWTYQKGEGRVFASIFGHYTWTLDDPLFRLIVLRAIGWVAGEDSSRLEGLAWTEKPK